MPHERQHERPVPVPLVVGPGDVHRVMALAFLARGITHDVANPLGAIRAFTAFLATDTRLPEDIRADARLLRGEAERANRLIGTLVELALARPPSVAGVDVPSLVADLLELENYALAGVTVERDLPDTIPAVQTDASRLRHVLLVLTVEAIRRLGGREATGTLHVQATAEPDLVNVVLRYQLASAGGSDRRGAVRPADSDSPSALEGAATLAEEIGAKVGFDPLSDGGRFVLQLPLGASPAAEPHRASTSASTRGPAPAGARPPRTQTVLVCDDEAAIRAVLARMLDQGGFATLVASSATDALHLLETEPVDFVLTDQHMAGMSGLDLYRRAIELRPDLRTRFVIMSGDTTSDELRAFVEDDGGHLLGKPFDVAAISRLIGALTAR